MKVSYIAFRKMVTIKELFINSILRTYKKFFIDGYFPMTIKDIYTQQDFVYKDILPLSTSDSIIYIIALNKVFEDAPKYYYFYDEI